MKILLAVITLTVASQSYAEVKRVKWLEHGEGIQYTDSDRILADLKKESISIRDLVAIAPPKKGTAYRVRVVNWKPNGKVRAIWTYQLKHVNGAYEFQKFDSSLTKIEVKLGDSVLYNTKP